MEAIVIEPTEQCPRVRFNTDGKLLLEGHSLPENVASFYEPLCEYASSLNLEEATFDVNLEYFNTATSKKLLELFRCLDTNEKLGKVNVNWHYEEGDEDSVEMAEIYEEKCKQRTTFQFIMHAEALSLVDRVNFFR